MKSFKKALAVLLSVLMVAFSFPLTSFALPNPDNADGKYSTDEDIVLHAYVMDYDGQGAYAYYSNAYIDAGETGPAKTYDLHNLKKADLASEDGTFALVFTVEGMDAGSPVLQLMFDYANDPGVDVQPAAYGRRDKLTVGAAADTDSILETFTTYYPEQNSDSDTHTLFVTGEGKNVVMLNETATKGLTFDATTQMDSANPDSVFKGQVIAVLGMQMCKDELDLAKALPMHLIDGDTFFTSVAGDTNKLVVGYGSVDEMNNYLPSTKLSSSLPNGAFSLKNPQQM